MKYESPDFCLEAYRTPDETRRALIEACRIFNEQLPKGVSLILQTSSVTYNDGLVNELVLELPDPA